MTDNDKTTDKTSDKTSDKTEEGQAIREAQEVTRTSTETPIGEAAVAADDADESVAADESDAPVDEAAAEESQDTTGKPRRRIKWSRVLVFGVLPVLALLLGAGAGFLKWQDNSVRGADTARAESMQAAKDSTAALLSYKADTVEQQLGAARDRLTGEFRDSYTSLTTDVVIPGAKQKNITAAATIPAAASVSADPNHAVVLVFVNQTVTVGNGPPSDTASSVRVTLDKVGDRWLISKFDPV